MCKSKAAGGQRCSSHAAQRLAKAQQKKQAVEAAFADGEATGRQVTAARTANWTALVEYASTSAGAQALRGQLAMVPEGPNADLLRGAIDDGALLAQTNRAAENEFRASQDKGPLTTPVPLTLEQEAAQAAEAAQAQAAAEVRNADPLGLRAVEAAGQAPAVVEPEAPTQVLPVQPPAGLPVAPPPMPARPQAAGLPTAPPPMPARPQAAGLPTAPPPALSRDERAAQVAQMREERARQAERVRQERAAQAAAAREARAQATARKGEIRRLQAETRQEAVTVAKWARAVASGTAEAPASTWPGPSSWQSQTPGSLREDMNWYQEGKRRFPGTFETAMSTYGRDFSPADVFEACSHLDAQMRNRVTGEEQPNGWYRGYEHMQPENIAAARQHAYAQSIGPNEVNVLAQQYVARGLDGVLAKAAKTRPGRRMRPRVGARARMRVVRFVTESLPRPRPRAALT